ASVVDDGDGTEVGSSVPVSGSDDDSDPSGSVPVSGGGGVEAEAPLWFEPGSEFSLSGSDYRLAIRSGETRTAGLTFVSYSPVDVTYPLYWILGDLPAGVSVVSVLPESVLVPAGETVVVPVELAAAANADPTGVARRMSVVALHPTLPGGHDPAGGSILVQVVESTAVIGPVLGSDLAVVSGGEVTVWDVLANDAGGDNELDPGSVSIVSQPERGLLVANPDGTISVDVTGIGPVSTWLYDGKYEVCDIAGHCATTDIAIETTTG
ncbi:MAG: hypothetical protein GY925_22625, partial [Actinomycetia bacterium]|nr:hypothetical protein [Actinomycetes bacterium]